MTPSHQTRASTQTVFNLSQPHPVIYNFTNLSTDGLKITIPPYSLWICPAHWHETAPACETLAPIKGHFVIYETFVPTRGAGSANGNGDNPPSFIMPLKINLEVRWERHPNADLGETVVFALKPSADEAYDLYGFYRQLCGVNQDAELYFHLSSTPLWLRASYAFWGWLPYIGARVGAWLVAKLLWVQLRVIYAENEGHIPYTKPWGYIPAPLVLKVCHWVGINILGMKAEYEEYEVDSKNGVCGDKKKDLL